LELDRALALSAAEYARNGGGGGGFGGGFGGGGGLGLGGGLGGGLGYSLSGGLGGRPLGDRLGAGSSLSASYASGALPSMPTPTPTPLPPMPNPMPSSSWSSAHAAAAAASGAHHGAFGSALSNRVGRSSLDGLSSAGGLGSVSGLMGPPQPRGAQHGASDVADSGAVSGDGRTVKRFRMGPPPAPRHGADAAAAAVALGGLAARGSSSGGAGVGSASGSSTHSAAPHASHASHAPHASHASHASGAQGAESNSGLRPSSSVSDLLALFGLGRFVNQPGLPASSSMLQLLAALDSPTGRLTDGLAVSGGADPDVTGAPAGANGGALLPGNLSSSSFGGLMRDPSMQNLRSLLRNASSAANLADMDGGMLEQHLHSFAALSRSASFGQANSTLGGSQHRSTGAVVGARLDGMWSTEGSDMLLPCERMLRESPSVSSLIELVRSSSANSLVELMHSYSATNLASLVKDEGKPEA
jgi:hypothetical protein